ncbi:MAG TPA: metallophosphoesterase, partial [Castellaniella sp.]|nr:metallophosphoesterase [Castellaniella sp.]
MTSTHRSEPLMLNILSDLHLGVQGMPLPRVQADITILAGDIARPAAAMQWASQFDRPVVYVAGNHEFYGGSIPAVRDELARCAKACGVHLLDQKSLEIGGVRFLGTTLWTDFQLFGAECRDLAMERSAEFMRDFQVIRNADGSTYTPQDS